MDIFCPLPSSGRHANQAMLMFIPIKTERLELRPPTADDIPNIVKYAGHKSIADGTINIPHPYSEQDAKNWLDLINTNAAKGEQANFGMLGITIRAGVCAFIF